MASYSDEEYYYMLENLLLSATEQIRQVFKERFKLETGEDWLDDQGSLKKFANGLGQHAYFKCLYYQKALMTSKPLETWDISLLSTIIQNFGDVTKYEEENNAVFTLRKLRNELAHHTTKKIPKDNYHEKMKDFHVSLKVLGMKADDINELAVQSEEASFLKSFQYVLALFAKADQLLKNGKVEEAATCYNEAVEVPNLKPNVLAMVLEKRAEFHLNLVENPVADRKKIDQAFEDMKKALDLNDDSWIGHHLMAKCFKWKHKLPEAIQHYERSLAISPGQKEVKDGLDACKILANQYAREDHLNPSLMAPSVGEQVDDFKARTGIKVTKKEVINAAFGSKKSGSVLSALSGYNEDYTRGIQNLFGYGIPPNFVEAVKYFKKAASTKHPEAMYQLALCYYNGQGTAQNLGEAIRIYREVAEMDPKTPGASPPTQTNCNEGVVSAQHALGLAYQTGGGLDVNMEEAVKWYRRAMGNGSGGSALNLGTLCSMGQGVPVDFKMAELCWKEAVNLNSAPATGQLVEYYINSLEPGKATHYFKIGRQMGYEHLLRFSEEDFYRQVREVEWKRLGLEPKVEELERSEKLETKGFTFRERVDRMLRYTCPEVAATLADIERNRSQSQYHSSVIRKKTLASSELKEITKRAKEGSQTAQRVMDTFKFEADLEKMLCKEDAKQFTETEKLDILNLAYQCVTKEWNLVRLSDVAEKNLSQIMSMLMADNKFDAKSDMDMKFRLCYALVKMKSITLTNDMFVVELLKEGLRRYPDNNVTYYQFLTVLLFYKKQYKLSQFYAEEGLKKHPTDLELLYAHAKGLFQDVYTGKSGKVGEGCIPALEKFICNAPPDNRYLPDVFYMLCIRLIGKSVRIDAIPFAQVLNSFKRGQLSEENQLPCFSSCDDLHRRKTAVEKFLGNVDAKKTTVETKLSSTGGFVLASSPNVNQEDVLTRKPYLKAPTRKNAFKVHRESFKESTFAEQLQNKLAIATASSVHTLVQTVPKQMSLVKPISVDEMNPIQDHLYQNRIIHLTVIDEPNYASGGIHLLVEDDNGDVTRVQVHNLEKSKENLTKFGPGCRFSMLNPVLKVELLTQINYLRNDEPKCIRYLQKVEKMCRFCGVENAEKMCSKCKRPYCSKECQVLDWKTMNHKLICSMKLKPY